MIINGFSYHSYCLLNLKVRHMSERSNGPLRVRITFNLISKECLMGMFKNLTHPIKHHFSLEPPDARQTSEGATTRRPVMSLTPSAANEPRQSCGHERNRTEPNRTEPTRTDDTTRRPGNETTHKIGTHAGSGQDRRSTNIRTRTKTRPTEDRDEPDDLDTAQPKRIRRAYGT